MGDRNYKTYEFGEYRLMTEDGVLWRGSDRVAITPKAVELLTLLLENAGRVVSRDEIIERLWPDTFVDENNLSVTASMLRKAFAETAENAKLIETIPRKGYRLNADVTVSPNDLVFAEREYTRAVIETTEIDDQGAGQAIAQLQTRSRRQRNVLLLIAAGLLILAGSVAWIYFRAQGPFSRPTVYSVAVMPLKELSGEEDGRRLAIGITDSLITRLSAVRGLSVRPMSAVLPFADNDRSAAVLGRELSVDAVLEGTIQRNGEMHRISVQIVSVNDNQVLWANVVERSSANIFEFQRSIAAQVTDALAFKLSQQDRKRLTEKTTENSEAFREHLLGRFFLNKRTIEDLKKAIPHFEKAIEIDQGYADPYAGMAAAYMLLSDSGYGGLPPNDGYPKAIAYATKTLELDESQAEAHAVLGNVTTGYGWDAVEGERQLRRAIELSPSLASAHLWLGWNLIVQQRFYEASEAIAQAAQHDPTSMIIASDIGYPAFFAGDYYGAAEHFRLALERDRNFLPGRFNLWRSLFYGGRYEEAEAEIGAISALMDDEMAIFLMAKGCTLARRGKIREAKQIYLGLRERQRAGEFIAPNLTASLAAELDETDDLFKDLESFLRDRNDYTPYLRFAPEFSKYRSDQRFESILNRAGTGG